MYDKNQSILPFGLIIINKKSLYFKIKVEVLFLAKDCYFNRMRVIVNY